MISTLLALPYELARLPLAMIDARLSERLAETSGARLALDRTLGTVDKLAGTLMGNRTIVERGADRLERSEKLLTAARLEEQAEARREQARDTAAAGRREATQKRMAAQDRAVSGLDEADATEARGKSEAEDKAAKTKAAKQATADQKAARHAATVQERKERVDSAAEAKKNAAAREAKEELKDVRETKQSAADARTDAERLHELTEAKKQERKQS